MADKLKINQLEKPNNQALPFYNDWIIDLVKIQRKEVAAFMHINTRIALAIPLFEIGGAKNLLNSFPALLQWAINDLCVEGYEDFGSQIRQYFEPNINLTFFKTDNRGVTTHLNQFKRILTNEAMELGYIAQTVCDSSSQYWQTALISNPHKKNGYVTPLELWCSYLLNEDIIEGEVQAPSDNVAPFPLER